jgi:hypothetical protein
MFIKDQVIQINKDQEQDQLLQEQILKKVVLLKKKNRAKLDYEVLVQVKLQAMPIIVHRTMDKISMLMLI